MRSKADWRWDWRWIEAGLEVHWMWMRNGMQLYRYLGLVCIWQAVHNNGLE